jgi:hypothetical protein
MMLKMLILGLLIAVPDVVLLFYVVWLLDQPR